MLLLPGHRTALWEVGREGLERRPPVRGVTVASMAHPGEVLSDELVTAVLPVLGRSQDIGFNVLRGPLRPHRPS